MTATIIVKLLGQRSPVIAPASKHVALTLALAAKFRARAESVASHNLFEYLFLIDERH